MAIEFFFSLLSGMVCREWATGHIQCRFVQSSR